MFRATLFSLLSASLLLTMGSPASAISIPTTETFNTNSANWLNVTSTAVNYNPNGGLSGLTGDGYISVSHTVAGGGFAAGPFVGSEIIFRGNGTGGTPASGGAFAGNWNSTGITEISFWIRHNYSENLGIGLRITSGSALVYLPTAINVAPNTWTQVTAHPFIASEWTSAGGTWPTLFDNIQHLQPMLLTTNVNQTGQVITFDLDQVQAVPEPSTFALAGLGLVGMGGLVLRRRRAAKS